MERKFIIKSFGRSGSTFIHYWVVNNFNCYPVVIDKDFSGKIRFPKACVSVHTHNYWLPEKLNKWSFIHVKRKNIFDQAISNVITDYTKQYSRYNKQYFKPILVSRERIIDLMQKINYWNKIFDVQSELNFFKKYCFYFEDFINNPDMLNVLGPALPNYVITKKLISQKNPRKPADIIENYFELKWYFTEMYKDI